MKSEAQTPSSSRPSVGATAVPVAETPIAEAPVAEADVAETSVMEERPRLKLLLPPPFHLLPWRQGEQAMANHGPRSWRLLRKNHFKGAGQLNTPTLNPGGVS